MKTETHAGRTFEFAETYEDFRPLYGPTSDLAKRKSLTELDEHCRNFIARSPFVCLATSELNGPADISPRGDHPGFVVILDANTLFIPDRLGNNRLDSLTNLVRNPELGLLFLVPGVDETLRVNGTGRIVVGGDILDACIVNNKRPTSGLLVSVREAFLQCAKALKRSHLWSPESRIVRTELPTLGKMLADQIGVDMPLEQLDAAIETAYREKLY
jgi:PPOX class probable FMN-dependent enzyme